MEGDAGRPIAPRGVRVAIVGGGIGALVAHTALRFLGMDGADIAVLARHADPFATYRTHAWGVGQTIVHTDPLGHFLPADWPTGRALDVMARPGRAAAASVADMAAQARAVARTLGYAGAVTVADVAEVVRADDGDGPHFGLYDAGGALVVRARHVLLALGHGPMLFPDPLHAARTHPLVRKRVVHAYEPKRYVPGGRYVVVGGGLAAVNEWVNCLNAGAECISVRRDAVSQEDLTAPLCLFDSLGIDAYRGLTHSQRLRVLGEVVRSATAGATGWHRQVTAAVAEGRFREVVGEVAHVAPGPDGVVVTCDLHGGGSTGPLHATGLTAATGFDPDPAAIPVMAQLIGRYDPPRVEGRLALAPNCGVPSLDRPESRLCVTGYHAGVAVPHADTVAGLKYVARRFADDVMRAEGTPRRGPWGRARIHSACVRAAVREIRLTPVA